MRVAGVIFGAAGRLLLPPTTDIGRTFAEVRLVATTGLMHRSPQHLLFDCLVGAGEQAGGHLDGEGFRGLEVDQQLKLRGLLDRQFRRFRAL